MNTTEKPSAGVWTPLTMALPPEHLFVDTKIDDTYGVRLVQRLERRGRLWFVPDGTYVYYTPTHWKRAAT